MLIRRLFSGLAKRPLIVPRLVVMQLDEAATGATAAFARSGEVSDDIVKRQFQSLFSPHLVQLSKIFSSHGYELRLAGGAVRDLLMLKKPHDLDFATTATPDEMVAMFNAERVRMINTNGLAHGTVTARIGDAENFEITTLRIDRETDGRHAKVEFTRDWSLDASRRDLTINAMFLDLDGKLYDYFDGRIDLAARRVRFVGDPGDRIREDYLRILRYFRFHGRIATSPLLSTREENAETLRAVTDNANGLASIAGERIWVEVKQILAGQRPDDLLAAMSICGVTSQIGLPAEPDIDELSSVLKRQSSVNNDASTENRLVPAALLAALLRTEAEADTVHARLRLSNEELGCLRFIMQHRESVALLVERGADFDEKRNFLQDLAALTSGKDPRTKHRIIQLLLYTGQSDAYLSTINQWWPPKFPVNGHNVLSNWRLSIAGKGPILGKILDLLRLEWQNSRYTADEATLLRDDVRVRVLQQLGVESAAKRSVDEPTASASSSSSTGKKKKTKVQPVKD